MGGGGATGSSQVEHNTGGQAVIGAYRSPAPPDFRDPPTPTPSYEWPYWTILYNTARLTGIHEDSSGFIGVHSDSRGTYG